MATHYHLHIVTECDGLGRVQARLDGADRAVPGGLRAVGATEREAIDHLLARIEDRLAGDSGDSRALLDALKE